MAGGTEDRGGSLEVPIDGTLDLHTFRPEDAADLVTEYLDACRERGILDVRVIHGKGTGALRETVHAALRRHPAVVRFGLASGDASGWGATLVRLAPRGLSPAEVALAPAAAPGVECTAGRNPLEETGLRSHDAVNRKTYESGHIVSLYCSGEIQPAEVNIFVRHREAYWGKKVLDLGCGAGRTTRLLATFDVDYTGVDYSAAMVERCRARFPETRCLQCDARDLSRFGDGAFDFALFSNNGLDCMVHEDRLRALAEINRVLADGGLFVFSSHNREYTKARGAPRIERARDPVAQVAEIKRYFERRRNYRANRKFERFEDEYCIVNDRSHRYSLLTYYIDLRAQARQLTRAGFELLEAYDRDGLSRPFTGSDTESSWIYYVARKTGPPDRA